MVVKELSMSSYTREDMLQQQVLKLERLLAAKEETITELYKKIDDLEQTIADWQYEVEPDESMDGDHASALASCGWGTDEDYGCNNCGED